MIPLLAEISQDPPPGFDAWLASLFYLMGIITAGVVLYKQLRPRPAQHMHVAPQPFEVKGHVEYTPLSVHREFSKEVNERFAAMSAASSAGRQKIYELIRAQNEGLHNRITDLFGLVREMKGKLDRNTNPPHS